MRRSSLLLVGLLAVACSAAPAAPARAPSVYDGSPSWVTRGGGAFGGDKGKAFYGVGMAANIQMASLRRSASDAQARADIAKAMNTYVADLLKSYQESTAAVSKTGTSPQEVQMVTDTMKTFTQQQLNGAQIVDRWISNDGSTEFALAQLDFDQFKDSMNKVTELNDRMRDVIKARADNAFDQLSKEETKHGQ